jgi:hypothetical protein
MNSRRLIAFPEAQDATSYRLNPMRWKGVAARPIQPGNVRFGSEADISTATNYVRFTPESGHVRCS